MVENAQDPPPEPPLALLLGLPFHVTDMARTLRDCEAAADLADPRYIVTPNVDFVAQAHENAELRHILFFAYRVICDGMPLVWLSRWFKAPLPERVAGSDLVHHLFELADRKKYRVFFFGSDEKTFGIAREALERDYPGMTIAGFISPPLAKIEDWDNNAYTRQIQEARPHLLLVCLGCPKQELWIARYHREMRVPLSLGVGASLDFIAGKQTRAPRWMQKSGLEWFWRLSTDPKRLVRRYVRDFYYLAKVSYLQWRFSRRRPQHEHAQVQILEKGEPPESAGDYQQIVWTGSLERSRLEDFAEPQTLDRHILLECSAIAFLDSSGLGKIAGLARKARDAGVGFGLLTPSHTVRNLVLAMRLEQQLPAFQTVEEARAKFNGLRAKPGPESILLNVRGDLDYHTLPSLEETLRQQAEPLPVGSTLNLRCDQVRLISSYAVARLLHHKKLLSTRGIELFLCDPSPSVTSTLRNLKLQRILLKQ